MEVWKIIVICVIVSIVCVGLYIAMAYQNRGDRAKIYIHLATKKGRYKILYRCRMKLPVERYWVCGVIYVDLLSGKVYVREMKDFFNKFITLKDWENNEKQKAN